MVKQAYLNKESSKKINSFLLLVKKHNIDVSQAILFGSHAKGTAGPDSDIDIAVFSKQFGEDIPEEMMFLRKLALKVDSRIEPIPFSPDDINDKYSSIIQEIKSHGKRLS